MLPRIKTADTLIMLKMISLNRIKKNASTKNQQQNVDMHVIRLYICTRRQGYLNNTVSSKPQPAAVKADIHFFP